MGHPGSMTRLFFLPEVRPARAWVKVSLTEQFREVKCLSLPVCQKRKLKGLMQCVESFSACIKIKSMRKQWTRRQHAMLIKSIHSHEEF